MTSKKTTRKKKPEEMQFEESLERLEKIVGEMESGNMPLDEMIARFEEGQTLLKFCTKKLNEVERKIELLASKGEKLVTEPFDESSVAEDDAEDGVGDTEREGDLF